MNCAIGDLAIMFKKNRNSINYVPMTYGDESKIIRAKFFPSTVEMIATEGKYPNWRKVVPNNISYQVAQFQPAFVNTFGSIAKYLSARAAISIGYNGKGGSVILIPYYGADFIGILMPMRDETEIKIPVWAVLPDPVAEPAAA